MSAFQCALLALHFTERCTHPPFARIMHAVVCPSFLVPRSAQPEKKETCRLSFIVLKTQEWIVLSRQLRSALPQRAVVECFAAYEGEALQLAKDAVLPDEKYLAVHHAFVFQK